MTNVYWTEITPRVWKKKPNGHKKKLKAASFEACKNPFHFLSLIHPTVTSSPGTCTCSAQFGRLTPKKHKKFSISVCPSDVRQQRDHKKRLKQTSLSFIRVPEKTDRSNPTHEDLSGLDHKHSKPTFDKHSSRRTGDIPTDAQDRTKKFKQR